MYQQGTVPPVGRSQVVVV